MTREKDILYQRGSAWITRTKAGYTVFVDGITYATSDSTYASTNDGYSIAMARVDYLSRRLSASHPPQE